MRIFNLLTMKTPETIWFRTNSDSRFWITTHLIWNGQQDSQMPIHLR